jgi:hypothetical protein
MSFALQTMISTPSAAGVCAEARSFGAETRQWFAWRGLVINWRAYSETWRLT